MDPDSGKPGTGWTALRSVCVQFPRPLLQGSLALFDADVGPRGARQDQGCQPVFGATGRRIAGL
jgi:hypothetical protein